MVQPLRTILFVVPQMVKYIVLLEHIKKLDIKLEAHFDFDNLLKKK